MARAVIFDMYETLVTQFCSPLYYGSEIARDLGLSPVEFLPGWRATEETRATGKLTFEDTMEQLMKAHGIYIPELHRQEMNHSPKFWVQVEQVLPDYRKSRE